MIDQAAFLNLMKYLFARDVLIQFIRFELADAWKHDLYFMKALNLINVRCFNFI